jgi:hypothetical protein
MNTAQNIIFFILGLSSIIGFIGGTLSKKESTRASFTTFLFIICAFWFVVSFSAIKLMNEYSEKAKDKYPEYEKLENVYKLKQ